MNNSIPVGIKWFPEKTKVIKRVVKIKYIKDKIPFTYQIYIYIYIYFWNIMKQNDFPCRSGPQIANLNCIATVATVQHAVISGCHGATCHLHTVAPRWINLPRTPSLRLLSVVPGAIQIAHGPGPRYMWWACPLCMNKCHNMNDHDFRVGHRWDGQNLHAKCADVQAYIVGQKTATDADIFPLQIHRIIYSTRVFMQPLFANGLLITSNP